MKYSNWTHVPLISKQLFPFSRRNVAGIARWTCFSLNNWCPIFQRYFLPSPHSNKSDLVAFRSFWCLSELKELMVCFSFFMNQQRDSLKDILVEIKLCLELQQPFVTCSSVTDQRLMLIDLNCGEPCSKVTDQVLVLKTSVSRSVLKKFHADKSSATRKEPVCHTNYFLSLFTPDLRIFQVC